jgi:hypothetical protein
MAGEIKVSLDKPRAIRWTHRAEFTLGSITRPPTYTDLAHSNPHRAFYALCVFVWAALVEQEHPFAAPSDLAPHLESVESQQKAFAALVQALRDAGVLEQKKTPETASGFEAGPSPSSSSAPGAPTTTTALQLNGPRSIASG